MSTRRETISELLEEAENPMTAQEICNMLGIKNRALVYEDIEHISLSVKNRGKQLIIQPASCGKCGYVFKDRRKIKRPSKCPKCRSQWILQPAYMIRDTK
ncbi:MAG: transcriptional regulator [Candidatus Thorarchaeota archaeon]